MTTKTLQKKIRLGIKDDSSLHELYWEMRREREAMGLPPENDSSNPEKIFVEWRRKHAAAKSSARKSSRKDKRHIREFAVLIEPTHADGYLAYCSAVNGKRMHGETVTEAQKKMTAYLSDYLGKLVAQGKPLPSTGTRIKKIKIAASLLE